MIPSTSFGVICEVPSLGGWRGVGDVDDCALCSDLMCVHAVAPWTVLRATSPYREAAGNPDDPTQGDGLTIFQSEKALRTFYPEICGLAGFEVVEHKTGNPGGAAIADRILKSKTVASVSVMAGKLPNHGSFVDKHRIAVRGDGTALVVGNPLKAAYTNWTPITPAQLAAAIDAYPKGQAGGVIYFPTADAAFTKHPLYAGAVAAAKAEAKAAILKAIQAA